MLTRKPRPALRPFLRALWASDTTPPEGATVRERVLPTGLMHVAFRLSADPFRILDARDGQRAVFSGHAVVGGARSGPYLRETKAPAESVGALLSPGACETLLGVPASVLGESHTSLEDLWGHRAIELIERLAMETRPAARLDILQDAFAARLPRLRALHPAVAHALVDRDAYASVRALVQRSGYSHRRFNVLFRDAVGMTPKRYGRVLRFSALLEELAASAASLADLAAGAGYSDQSHFQRDFRELAGMTPGEYRASAPQRPHHVPIRFL